MTSINKLSILILTTFLLTHTHSSNSKPLDQHKQALLSFISQLPHSPRILWNSSTSVCTWVGVACDPTHTYVHTLRLPAVGLIGPIPDNTIGRLTQLRVLSIHSNYLSGSLPHDLANLTLLRGLYIGNNNFSGSFPLGVTRLTRLTRLDLSHNNFSGSIPISLNNLTRLNGLFLQSNRFTGSLPNLNKVETLIDFNVSNNHLNGSIPKKLTSFPLSSFMGNLQLCGGPLPPCKTPLLPPTSPSSFAIVPSSPAQIKHKNSNNHLSKWGIIGIILASIAVFSIVLVLFIIFCLTKTRRSSNNPTTTKSFNSRGVVGGFEPGTSSSKDDITTSGNNGGTLDRNKLVNVNNVVGRYVFELEDLLRASAEVLGKGSMGTSYKAVLEDGTTVVVKRLKDVVVGKREFEEQMDVIGKCNKQDENVGVLRGYYYSKDEKLLVFDYFAAGSLSALLHGSRISGRTTLDWENRKRIALSTARGLTYLHNSNNLIHANIKSSNILLQPNITTIVISDFGLTPLFAPNQTSSTTRLAGYRAPEVIETQKPTFKSDVYSYGVLLLEILTGKSPNQASLGDEGVDLPRWVQSVVREEWTAEVFDVELMKYGNNEEEMVQLLQIAMACVAIVPDQRPSMHQVLRMIEEMSRSSESVTDDGIRQSSDDPSKGLSDSQTPPKEEQSQTTPPYSPLE